MPGRRKGEQEVFSGVSFVDEGEMEVPQLKEDKTPAVGQKMPGRHGVVHSTQLCREQARTLQKHISKEQQRLSEDLKGRYQGNITRAAAEMGLHRQQLQQKIRDLGLREWDGERE